MKQLEDVEIDGLVKKEIASGLKVITDGEFRRENFILDFLIGHIGIEVVKYWPWEVFPWAPGVPVHLLKPAYPWAVRKISFNPKHPEFEHFEYLKSVTPSGFVPKVIIPSPTHLFATRDKDLFPSEYKSLEEFDADLSTVYKESILGFYSRGARLIQIDEPSIFVFPYLSSSDKGEQYKRFHLFEKVYIEVFKPFWNTLPKDLKMVIHFCRGNGDTHMPIPFTYLDALPLLVAAPPAYVLLEYDDERSGSFEVLKEYAAALPNTNLFLGVVTTKNAIVETVAQIEARVHEAAKYVPLSRLGITTQCGFGTTKEGNPTTPEAQWGKVVVLTEAAKKIWGDN